MEAQVPLMAVPLQYPFGYGEDPDTSYNNFNDAFVFPNQAPWSATGLAYRSREPSVVAAEPPKQYPSAEEWNNIKKDFTRLYSTENKTLTEVKERLEREHGFVASERMYKERAKKWNLRKNLKKAEKTTRIQEFRQTRNGKQLLHNGRNIIHRLERHCKENKIPLEVLQTVTRNVGNGDWGSSSKAKGRTDPAQHCLQSLFRSPSQPAQPIALYGGMRTAEVIIWNTKNYLNHYFADGPGTRYFKVDPTAAASKRLPSSSLVLVKNEEAWKDVVDPEILWEHILDALNALNIGLVQSALATMGKAFALVEDMFRQQEPTLLCCLLLILVSRTSDDSNLARETRQFILGMAVTVLGEGHSVTKILSSLCTLSSVVEKCYIWRAVIDMMGEAFEPLQGSTVLLAAQRSYLTGLEFLKLFDEAENFLDVVWNKERMSQEINIECLRAKGNLLCKKRKFKEAEIPLRKCLVLLEENENEILVHGTNSTSCGWLYEIEVCLDSLAEVLERTERFDEAKAMRWRSLELAFAGWGADDINTQVVGSDLDDLLTDYGYVEESKMLRARCPWLLTRQKLPRECL